MKHFAVAILTLFIFSLMFYTYKSGKAYHGKYSKKFKETTYDKYKKNYHGKYSKRFTNLANKDNDKLNALRGRVGNIGRMKLSKFYKVRCASCHGARAQGLVGPKLYGQSSDEIFKKLLDFKSGKKENSIVKGLFINISKKELKEVSIEIENLKKHKK